ncbi:nectin-1-like [Polypterus senegalus]|uniref:nectin-1-like n=1 Tax=Polypterus senegalus TaxID=55291 RepID=UPI0019666DF7|nr:nectin-1-like [Polypterus senegalus]XP_039599609.1 nectin-1-like [Polypterus senegalus]XP_039599611.1 nectin-1-like [Polypterus senegalus]
MDTNNTWITLIALAAYMNFSYSNQEHCKSEDRRFEWNDKPEEVKDKVTAILGGDVTLRCVLNGVTEILSQITWQRWINEKIENFLIYHPTIGPRPLVPFARRVTFVGKGTWDGSIIIKNVSLSDEGKYNCIFTTFPSGSHDHFIKLFVQVIPSITVSSANILLAGKGEVIVATCIAAHGKPAAKVSWKTHLEKESHVMEEFFADNCTVTIHSQLLTFPTKEMNQLELHCVVTHPTFQQPEILPYTLNISYPPSVVLKTFQDEPDQLTLYCEADANPAPTKFIWMKEHKMLQNMSTNKIFLTKLAPHHTGLYSCEASNQYGTGNGNLFLFVEEPFTDKTRMIVVFIPVVILTLTVLTFTIKVLCFGDKTAFSTKTAVCQKPNNTKQARDSNEVKIGLQEHNAGKSNLDDRQIT